MHESAPVPEPRTASVLQFGRRISRFRVSTRVNHGGVSSLDRRPLTIVAFQCGRVVLSVFRVETDRGQWRHTHLLPKLHTLEAANRIGTGTMYDVHTNQRSEHPLQSSTTSVSIRNTNIRHFCTVLEPIVLLCVMATRYLYCTKCFLQLETYLQTTVYCVGLRY